MSNNLTISLYDTGALRASANSCALALTLPLRVLIVLIASLILFLDLLFEFNVGCLLSRGNCACFRGSQRSVAAYLIELECDSLGSVVVSGTSSMNGGNLSIGLVICCEVVDVAGT